MSENIFSAKSQSEGTQLARIFEVTGCRTQVELANLLGIRQSSVSEVLKRNKVPARWLIKLQHLGVNIEWVAVGIGPQYRAQQPNLSDGGPMEPGVPYIRAPETAIINNILRCLPSQDLITELNRRSIYCDKPQRES